MHSDWLCRLSTGGGYSKRQLYSNSDEIELKFTKPIILNGIDNNAWQSDLISRAIIINLSEITASRMQEKDLWQLIDENKASMLGELCDGIVSILDADEPDVKLERMADFIIWVTKAEDTFGWNKHSFQKACVKNKKETTKSRLEYDPMFTSITKLVQSTES